MHAAELGPQVFWLCFLASFLLAGKRPVLTLSTRLLLVVVLALGFGYILSEHSSWHATFGTGTLIANVVFIGCALIDYVRWHKGRVAR